MFFAGKINLTNQYHFAIIFMLPADVAELADAPDLGSGVPDVQVQVLSSAPPYEKWLKTYGFEPFFCFGKIMC